MSVEFVEKKRWSPTSPNLPHPRLPPAWAAWTACTKRHRKALKLLGFWDAQKRIYAKLTPLTPKIQAHYRVTEIGTCLKKQVPIFLICVSFCLFRVVAAVVLFRAG